jgi:hypothetical protein
MTDRPKDKREEPTADQPRKLEVDKQTIADLGARRSRRRR